MIENYIWDFDGTLYDTYPIMLDAYIKTLKGYDIEANRQEIYQILKAKSSASVASKYQLDFEEFATIFKNHEKQDQRIPISYLGTKEMLEKIIQSGKKNYIMTHRTVASTKELLEKEGMLDLFVEIVGTENNFARKPDPEALTYLVEKYQMNPENTVMIGDRTMDVEAGKNAGIKTIFYDIESILEDISADITVNSVKEMEDYI